MDFKKCPRCGNFYTSILAVCQKCQTNENIDIQKLKNYFDETEDYKEMDVQEISYHTGITPGNLSRYMISEDFSEYVTQEKNQKRIDNKE